MLLCFVLALLLYSVHMLLCLCWHCYFIQFICCCVCVGIVIVFSSYDVVFVLALLVHSVHIMLFLCWYCCSVLFCVYAFH